MRPYDSICEKNSPKLYVLGIWNITHLSVVFYKMTNSGFTRRKIELIGFRSKNITDVHLSVVVWG